MFKYQKKELRIRSSEYAEYIDDEKKAILVKNCLKFDFPLVSINNKGV